MNINTLSDTSSYLTHRGVWFAYLKGSGLEVIASTSLRGLQAKATRMRAAGREVDTAAYKVISDDQTEKFFNYV